MVTLPEELSLRSRTTLGFVGPGSVEYADVIRTPRPPPAITLARVQAIEISVDWRWAPVLALSTWLLAQNVLSARFPGWNFALVWLTAAAAVLAGELALLLHELSHALLARCYGQHVTRIVFHGLLAETIVGDGSPGQREVALIALIGPAINILIAGLAQASRLALAAQGPLDVFLVMLVLGNGAAAAMSLLPLGQSDGARALRSLSSR
jgi:Zn-dependent protease